MKQTTYPITQIVFILIGVIVILLSFYAYSLFLIWLSPLLFLVCIVLYIRRKSVINLVALIVSLLGVSRLLYIILIINLFHSKKFIVNYYIPDSYVGWVIVQFNQKEVPGLEMIDNHIYKVEVGENGLIRTATTALPRHASAYYLLSNSPAPANAFRKLPVDEVQKRIHCEQGNAEYNAFYFSGLTLNSADSLQILNCTVLLKNME